MPKAARAAANSRKYSTSIRINERTKLELRKLSDYHRISQTDVIEALIGGAARRLENNTPENIITLPDVLGAHAAEVAATEERRGA